MLSRAILHQQTSGFRIAPSYRTVKPWHGNWRAIHSAICTVASNPLAVIELDSGDRIFADEKFAAPLNWYFAVRGCQRPIAGYGLVLGPDRDGRPTPTHIHLSQLKENVLHLQFTGGNTFTAWNNADRPPKRMTYNEIIAWMQDLPQPAPSAPSP